VGRFRAAKQIGILGFLSLLPGAAQEVFRVDVRLVRVVATVKDKTGATIGGLNKEDFTIFDNGVEQRIALFERHTAQPLSVGIMIDTSGSTAKELKYETDSVMRFLRAFFKEGNPSDTAGFYSFNWEVRQLVDYTRRYAPFEAALRGLKAEAGTSLYDSIYLAAADIRDRPGRHVLIVVSDGGDTISAKGYHDALRAAHDADVVIYSILVMPITNDAGRNIGGENALTGLAESTGGKVFAPGINGLDMVFEQILRDLRTQYLLGFYPQGVRPTRDPFHKLTIRMSNLDLRVVSRTGYYGEAERPN
jgi:Ca-activated chloride channel family protein